MREKENVRVRMEGIIHTDTHSCAQREICILQTPKHTVRHVHTYRRRGGPGEDGGPGRVKQSLQAVSPPWELNQRWRGEGCREEKRRRSEKRGEKKEKGHGTCLASLSLSLSLVGVEK